MIHRYAGAFWKGFGNELQFFSPLRKFSLDENLLILIKKAATECSLYLEMRIVAFGFLKMHIRQISSLQVLRFFSVRISRFSCLKGVAGLGIGKGLMSVTILR